MPPKEFHEHGERLMSQSENPVFSAEYDRLRDILIGARSEAKLSQAALAKRLGRSTTFVTLLECGQRRLDILDFYNLAVALERDPVEVAGLVFEGFRAAALGPENSPDSFEAAPQAPPLEGTTLT